MAEAIRSQAVADRFGQRQRRGGGDGRSPPRCRPPASTRSPACAASGETGLRLQHVGLCGPLLVHHGADGEAA
ncbi:hypothetical protein ACXKGW_28830, partial [Klebsiella pneumoniae subsp. pneumoniae]